MTLLMELFPSNWDAAYQSALDGGLLFLLLVVHVATELDRFQNKRGNHYDHRDNLEVRHDLTSP